MNDRQTEERSGDGKKCPPEPAAMSVFTQRCSLYVQRGIEVSNRRLINIPARYSAIEYPLRLSASGAPNGSVGLEIQNVFFEANKRKISKTISIRKKEDNQSR